MASSWEIYLTAVPNDASYTGKLYDALRIGARVFWKERDIEPGSDVQRACEQALSRAMVSVFVLSRTSANDQRLGAEIASAIRLKRDESIQTLIPVYLDAEVSAKPPYGISNIHAFSVLKTADHEEIAKSILKIVARIRAQRKAAPRVAIVAVSDELGFTQQVVANRLRKLPGKQEVTELDASKSESFEQALKHDFRLVLVGGMRTGGTDVLKRLVDSQAYCLKMHSTDPTKFKADEIAAAMALWNSVRKSFASPDEAGESAQDLYLDWLKDWAPPKEGHSAVIDRWESKYLRARFDKWEKGSFGGLQARAGHQKLDRARLYVSLRAIKSPNCYADENERLVAIEEHKGSETSLTNEEEENKHRNPFLERVLSYPGFSHLAIEGEAGSGKTVLVQLIGVCAAVIG